MKLVHGYTLREILDYRERYDLTQLIHVIEQIGHALGIADYHAPNLPMMRDIDHPAMVKHGIGWGTMTGITAAQLAARGFTGVPSLFGQEEYAGWVADIGQHFVMAGGLALSLPTRAETALHGIAHSRIAVPVHRQRDALLCNLVVFQHVVARSIEIAPGTGQRIQLHAQQVQFPGLCPEGLDLQQQVSAPYQETDNQHPGGNIEKFHWQLPGPVRVAFGTGRRHDPGIQRLTGDNVSRLTYYCFPTSTTSAVARTTARDGISPPAAPLMPQSLCDTVPALSKHDLSLH